MFKTHDPLVNVPNPEAVQDTKRHEISYMGIMTVIICLILVIAVAVISLENYSNGPTKGEVGKINCDRVDNAAMQIINYNIIKQ